LYEVSEEGGDQQPEVDQDEERSTGHPGIVSQVQDQGISHRQVEELMFYQQIRPLIAALFVYAEGGKG